MLRIESLAPASHAPQAQLVLPFELRQKSRLLCRTADGEDAGPGVLRAHVARANPLWTTARDDVDALVVFQGPHGYVSPAWYPSKAEHGKVVPTWNYEIVHIHGRLAAHDDVVWVERLVRDNASGRVDGAYTILGLACMAVRLETPGSPIYRQRRVGKDGRHFDLLLLAHRVSRPQVRPLRLVHPALPGPGGQLDRRDGWVPREPAQGVPDDARVRHGAVDPRSVQPRADGDAATLRHGVDCVEHEVDEDFTQTTRLAVHQRDPSRVEPSTPLGAACGSPSVRGTRGTREVSAAETAKVAAFTHRARLAPPAANSSPPSSGPAAICMLKAVPISELALKSSRRSTSAGSRAVRAGA